MVIEAALIKPVVDVLMGLFKQGDHLRLQHNAEAALREAIRELLLASPDDNKAEARIAIAKAAGILSEDVVLAEDMLKKHRATKARTSGKASTGRRRKAASAAAATKADVASSADDAPAARKTPKPAAISARTMAKKPEKA